MPSKRKQLENSQPTKLATLDKRLKSKPADSKLDEHPDGSFVRIELDRIKPDPNQPRKHFDPEALKELSQSVKTRGVLQPVLIRKDGDMFWLVAGERRYRAAVMAGLKEIPAMFTTGNPAEIALIENLQREDLNPIEEAQAYERMIQEFKYTQEKLAAAIGKARATITHTLALNQLPVVIKEECARAHIPKRTLIEIARLDSPEKMISVFNRVKELNLTSDDVRSISKKNTRVEISIASLVMKKVRALANSLEKLDISDVAKKEKLALFHEIEHLQKLLSELLS